METRTIAANGLEFETDVAGVGGSKFALCLHGFPEEKYSWRYQIPLLVEEGYEVWAPNMRGYGGTSTPKEKSAYALKHLLADVAGLIDAGANGRPVTLIAHDWGALIAWAFAIEKLRPLTKLIIMNVPHPSVFLEQVRSPAQRKKSWYVYFFQLPWLPEFAMTRRGAEAIGNAFVSSAVNKQLFPKEVLDVYRTNALRPGGMTAMINYYRANFTEKAGLAIYTRDAVEEIKVPTLMVWGEQDIALGIELTEGYEGLVADLTLARLPDASHWVQQDQPEKVNAIMRAWLNR
jgi:epoxide hydrolase 4